jgi:hypothetical protein
MNATKNASVYGRRVAYARRGGLLASRSAMRRLEDHVIIVSEYGPEGVIIKFKLPAPDIPASAAQ